MNILEAMEERHSVRSYQKKPLDREIVKSLEERIDECNRESGLHIQLIKDEPQAFDSMMAHYGKFSGVTNYIAMIGKKGKSLDELCGYYGEKLVLEAQMLGLNTCWVAMTYKKVPGVFNISSDEKLAIVIAIGYGATKGIAHQSKEVDAVSVASDETPQWFKNGMKAAMLAPTAMNQQKFQISQNGNKVTAKARMGFYSKIDLGIVKYHFEIGAGKENFIWE